VRAAARAIRKQGYCGHERRRIREHDAGIDERGFYAPFPAREAMLDDAFEHAAEGIDCE